jgi:hypothetical protein
MDFDGGGDHAAALVAFTDLIGRRRLACRPELPDEPEPQLFDDC